MKTMSGVVTITQEGRFQLTDEAGVSHLFILSYRAPLEPDQLLPLQHRQARVEVSYEDADNLIGNVALEVVELDEMSI
jgi:hypothetical protein